MWIVGKNSAFGSRRGNSNAIGCTFFAPRSGNNTTDNWAGAITPTAVTRAPDAGKLAGASLRAELGAVILLAPRWSQLIAAGADVIIPDYTHADALLAWLCAHYARPRVLAVYLHVLKANAAARALYERAGSRCLGRSVNAEYSVFVPRSSAG